MQLSLFDNPSAELAPFPLSRRVGLVFEAVDSLQSRRTKAKRRAYWSKLVDKLERELRSLGQKQDAIERELRAFRRACQVELERRHLAGRHRSPRDDDAA